MTPDAEQPSPENPERSGAIDDAARAWVVRLASGAVTERDLARLDAWLLADPAHRTGFDSARATWRMAGGLEREFAAEAATPSARRSRTGSHRASGRRGTWNRIRKLAVAAGVSATVSAAVAMLCAFSGDLLLAWRADARTVVGEQRVVTLPDGSRAHLNTDSAIELDFGADERRVALLRGEVFFEVAPNPDRPFVVAALDGTTRAVGTAFVVREAADRVAVAVEEGRVRVTVSSEPAADPIDLSAGERGGYRRGAPPRHAGRAAPGDVAPWRGGRIVFDGVPLATAIAELDRYHPGRIVLMRSGVEGRPVSGVFSTGAVDGAVTALAAIQGLRVLRVTDYLLILR